MTHAFEAGEIPPIRLKHRLRIAREEAGLEQVELAERMGVSRNVISNAESGRTVPRKIVFNAWALATGVPVSWLERGVGDVPPGEGGPEGGGEVRPEGFEPPTFCLGARPAKPQLTLVPSPGPEAVGGPRVEVRAA
ncbi:immunity repressor [Mycobacterium phage Weirdo19]|uniref:Immunity repressor n=1 Tax=Mycobacterium phage Weirdo19 TaxID=2601610 RepID=A0A6M2YSY7_9CAUD|nr:transcriptional repressor [Mycobacterium phage Weirdo19]QEA10812.1 immunity repressor [Mycobacterium phage Weirdo19]